MKKTIQISGKVIRGDGYGRKIGYPTINIDRKEFSRNKVKLKSGIYSGKVLLARGEYRAGIIIGPLDTKGLPKLEAHLIGYRGNAYGKVAVFNIKKFIRKYKNFKIEKDLIFQIGKDLKKC